MMYLILERLSVTYMSTSFNQTILFGLSMESDDFKKLPNQNKNNRTLSTSGVLHTTGRRAHHDVAQDLDHLACKLGRYAYQDEIFLTTHKKKSSAWIDHRSERIYEKYQELLTQLTSVEETHEVDGAT